MQWTQSLISCFFLCQKDQLPLSKLWKFSLIECLSHIDVVCRSLNQIGHGKFWIQLYPCNIVSEVAQANTHYKVIKRLINYRKSVWLTIYYKVFSRVRYFRSYIRWKSWLGLSSPKSFSIIMSMLLLKHWMNYSLSIFSFKIIREISSVVRT